MGRLCANPRPRARGRVDKVLSGAASRGFPAVAPAHWRVSRRANLFFSTPALALVEWLAAVVAEDLSQASRGHHRLMHLSCSRLEVR